jgi:hypothetical protein
MRAKFLANERVNEIRAELVILAVLVAILSSCAPAVDPGIIEELGKGATVYGIQNAKYLISDGRLVMPIWMIKTADGSYQWGFSVLDMTSKDPIGKWRFVCGGRGMFTNCENMKKLATDLLSSGWAYKKMSDLPAAFVQAVQAMRITMIILPGGSSNLTGEILFPNSAEY